MIVSHLHVKNWRNFQRVDIALRERQFIVGANASGKSNLLDVFRFLRDIAKTEGGGLQKAVKDRGGVSKIRSLAARRDPEVAIEVEQGQVAPDVGDVLVAEDDGELALLTRRRDVSEAFNDPHAFERGIVPPRGGQLLHAR